MCSVLVSPVEGPGRVEEDDFIYLFTQPFEQWPNLYPYF